VNIAEILVLVHIVIECGKKRDHNRYDYLRLVEIMSQSRNKSILEIEQRLTELTETDPRNEEIYKLLKQLAAIYVNQNKFTYGYNGIEDVCHDVAADTWMAVLAGRKINAWIYYIGKMIKLSYVTKQRKLEHEIIETDNDPILRENIKRMCASSSISCTEEFDSMQRNILLDCVGSMIEEAMNFTKFKKGTKEYLAIHTNVCINLVREIDQENLIYFRISDNLKPYVKIVMKQFKKIFRDAGFTESIMDNVDADLEMQLVVDESYIRDGGRRKNG
jgi:hypothetical protein